MTATQARLLWAAGMFLAAWLFREKKTDATKVTQELLIDANVSSDSFGEPISMGDDADAVAANHARLVDLIDESNAAISAYDAAHPEPLP